MAIKLGEMQAQLTRLDAVGERLSTLAGLKPQEYRLAETPGLGGASATMMPPQNLTLLDFDDKLADVSQRVESRTDALGVLESQLLDQAVKSKLIPTMMPVSAPFKASGFGQRVDPFTGQWSMHEGIDFTAEVGTPVLAAAGGVVAFAGFHPQYGYMIDIDHGNDRDPLRALFQAAREGRRLHQARKEDRRERHDRPLDRAAPALRSPLQGRRAESEPFPVGIEHDPASGGGARGRERARAVSLSEALKPESAAPRRAAGLGGPVPRRRGSGRPARHAGGPRCTC